MTDNADAPKDPSQLVPPHVDSGLDYHGFKVNDLLYGTPGAGIVGASGLAALFGAPLDPSLVGAGVGVLGGLGAVGLAVSSGEYSTGLDRIKTPLAYVKAKRGFPQSGDEAATVHGVKRIHADGTAEMDDGRLVALARISGRNTTMQETSDAREMIGRIRGELDQHVSDFNFRLFSTALEVDPGDVIEKYRAKLYSSEYAGEEWKLARELLRSVIQWTENSDFPRFNAREWQHYLVVEVRPDEVTVSDIGEPFEEGTGRDVPIEEIQSAIAHFVDCEELLDVCILANALFEGIQVAIPRPENRDDITTHGDDALELDMEI